jgi:hypothetical protein
MTSRKNKMNAAYHGFKYVLFDRRLAIDIHKRLTRSWSLMHCMDVKFGLRQLKILADWNQYSYDI